MDSSGTGTTPQRRIGGGRARIAALALGGGLAVAVVGASPAHAGGCSAGVVCGAVNNTTGYTMHTTETLWSGPNICDLWNQDEGSGWSWGEDVACTQKELGSYSRRGGLGTDVDAFTFNYREYYVSFNGGSERKLTKGVWTRISNAQTATCASAFGSAPHCAVVGVS